MTSTDGTAIEGRAPLILIVDDSEELLELYAMLLEAEGFRVATRGDGRRGLEAVGKLRPDAVVLDMMMPEGDGLEFLKTLKDRGLPLPPVIACSGYERLREQALELGALAFLLKPVGVDDLVASLRAVLRHAPAAFARDVQLDHALDGRARAKQARGELLARVDLEAPALLARMDAVTRWLARFFDVTFAFVAVHLESELYDLAVAGASAQLYSSPRDVFCGELTEAGSTLLLEDAAQHPCFSSHAAARSGTRFYAGAPMVTPEGLVLGTVCLTDGSPRAFRSEDMRILEYLGKRIGTHVARLSQGAPGGAIPVTAAGAIESDMLAVLLTSELRYAARSGGALGLAVAEIAGDARDALAAASVGAPKRLAIAHRHGEDSVALLLGAEDASLVHRGLSRALDALSNGLAGMRGAGVAELRWAPDSQCVEDEANRLDKLAAQACERSVARGDLSVDWVAA